MMNTNDRLVRLKTVHFRTNKASKLFMQSWTPYDDNDILMTLPYSLQAKQLFDLWERDNDWCRAGESANDRVRNIIDQKSKFKHRHNQ